MEVREPSAKYLRTGSYKHTELGVLPTDWHIAEIGQIAETSSGTTPPRSQYSRYFKGGTHAWVKTLDLNNAEILETDESVTDKAVEETSLRLFPEGSVLVAMYGGLRQIGRTGLLRLPAAVNQAITAIRPNPTFFCPEFLLFYLNHRVGYWQSVASSSRKDPNITGADVRAFKLPLPEISEQRSVAAALTDADALIDSLEQLLAKKRQIKQGAMQELLTGKRRLPGSTAAWSKRRIGAFAPLQRGFDLPSRDRIPGPYPVVYSNGILNFHRESRVRGPGVVTGRSGTIGAVTFIEQDYWPHNTALWVTSFNASNPKFVFYLLQYIGLERFATGSGVPTLNRNDVHAFEVNVPASVDEQAKIAQVLSDMDADIAATEARLTKARDLKQAMAQALLTGRVRLVEGAAA